MNENIKDATFTSVWDGDTHITTNCKVDMTTRQVIDIEKYDGDEVDTVNTLDTEYVTIDGVDYPVFERSEYTPGDQTTFWYE